MYRVGTGIRLGLFLGAVLKERQSVIGNVLSLERESIRGMVLSLKKDETLEALDGQSRTCSMLSEDETEAGSSQEATLL